MRIRQSIVMSGLVVLLNACGDSEPPLPRLATAPAGVTFSEPVAARISLPLRDLPAASSSRQEGEVERRMPKSGIFLWRAPSPARDPLAGPNGVSGGSSPGLLVNFAGMDQSAGELVPTVGVSPPDTMGAVGPRHFVQMVNLSIAVYDKQGQVVVPPRKTSELWRGLPAPGAPPAPSCVAKDFGDPVVLFDELAQRWLISQFEFPEQSICVAISQTDDPTGSYWLYGFTVEEFPDYFKFAAWPDAYYMGSNEGSYAAYAFDRTAMLAGQPARYARVAGETNFLLPADFDGTLPPPAASPGLFFTYKDSAYPDHGGARDRLELFAFTVDFSALPLPTGNFDRIAEIPIARFDYTVCGFFNLSCVPQQGTTTKVDAVSEWPMFRFVYRNFGAHQTLAGNFTVPVASNTQGAPRWFELRSASGDGWFLFQEGTYAPDGLSRFMGSLGMDRDGNIALGYSVSGKSLLPSIRYTTRLRDDPPGTLRQEASILEGLGYQEGGERWGDYAAMSVDPVDDCTFWFTTMHAPQNSGFWATQIAAFRIPGCGTALP
jgi:hypothetical protein